MQNTAKKNVWCKMCYRIKLFAAWISIHIARSSFIRNYVLNVAHFCCASILWAFFTLCRIYIFKQPTSFSTAPHIYIRRFSTLSLTLTDTSRHEHLNSYVIVSESGKNLISVHLNPVHLLIFARIHFVICTIIVSHFSSRHFFTHRNACIVPYTLVQI